MDLIIVIPILVFLATAFLGLASYYSFSQRRPSLESRLMPRGSLGVGEVVNQELSRPFLGRVIEPLLHPLGSLMARVTPASAVEGTRQRLVLAGKRSSTAFRAFFAAKAAGLVLMPLLLVGAIWWLTRQPVLSPLYLVAALIFLYLGWRLPDFWLDSAVGSRKKRILRTLPDAMDLLTVCVEAGAALEAAFSRVAEKFTGPIRDEFGLVVREISLGKRRRYALQDMVKRTDVPDLSSFVIALVRAEQTGVSVGDVLRVQADGLRLRRRQRAQEQAQQAPVKMLFPLVLGIFPALFVVILGPAMIQVLKVFFK